MDQNKKVHENPLFWSSQLQCKHRNDAVLIKKNSSDQNRVVSWNTMQRYMSLQFDRILLFTVIYTIEWNSEVKNMDQHKLCKKINFQWNVSSKTLFPRQWFGFFLYFLFLGQWVTFLWPLSGSLHVLHRLSFLAVVWAPVLPSGCSTAAESRKIKSY